MAGIYIHIPFCRKACHYCNFHFSTSLSPKNDFLHALLNEIDLQKNYLNSETVHTIYFGGGTPSLLEANECNAILQKLKESFSIDSEVEVTLEANPDDITVDKLIAWQNSGINRLSIGVQSFFDEDLSWMNRAHTAKQSISSLELAKNYFNNITIDLIYGTPTLNDKKWKENINKAIELTIPHLSCYALTVEPKTALQKLIADKKFIDVNPSDQARQFLLLMEWMETSGYEHYEISNFALSGKRSKHNSSYWQGTPYLGLGPSAHSYNNSSRQWNIANNALYIQSLKNNELKLEIEILTPAQMQNEYIMTSLRTMEGLDNNYIRNHFGLQEEQRIEKATQHFIQQQLLEKKENNFILTKNGKLFADGIAADLFS